jgi:prepilin-type N-terminal cleavage/methylation domain-containing protein
MNPIVHNSNTACPNRNRNSAFRIPHSELIPSAFTLVELLIVIAIIGVLTAMSLTMLAGASNDAKISATQARISQITSILQLQMEDYEVRRLPISNRVLLQYVQNNRITINGSTEARNDRLQLKYLRRQLMMAMINSEMPRPRRIITAGLPIEYEANPEAGKFGSETDLNLVNSLPAPNGVGGQYGDPAGNFLEWIQNNYGGGGVSIGGSIVTLEALLNRTGSGAAQKWRQLANGNRGNNNDTPELYPAEFLYQILASIQIDGQSAVELLGNSAIANDDNDDFPEIVDAWGEPMLFDIEQLTATNDGSGRVTTDPPDTVGSVSLDPRVPRALGDLRIVIGSSRIPESLPVVERISRGVE